MEFLAQTSTSSLLIIIVCSFLAGLIDALVGGGGLIQLPGILLGFAKTPIPALMGTNKLAALAGTSISAFQYGKRIKFDYKVLITIGLFAAVFSYIGATFLSFLDIKLLRPVILGILIIMFLYTMFKKELGESTTAELSINQQILKGSLIGAVTGFYDGFFGPGTGSFLVLGFVSILGFDFLRASAYAKVINCFTGVGALILFVKDGNYIIPVAIIMAICNISGNLLGIRLAFKNGNTFIRKVFLLLVFLLILRYAYDIFFRN